MPFIGGEQGGLRRVDGFLALLILIGLSLTAAALRERAEGLAGLARIIDGDTLELAGRRLRLVGMDAPELDQICEAAGRAYRCGEVARDAMIGLAGRGAIACEVAGRDRYGRGLARCRAAGEDVGQAMVERGLAVAYGDYVADEARARTLRLGLWAGTFDRPAEWRKSHPR